MALGIAGRPRTKPVNVQILAAKLAKIAERNPNAMIYVNEKAIVDIREADKKLVLTFS